MQITRQADYAIRTILYLSQNPAIQRAATRQIAQIQEIPISFLAKIISQLAIAGIIHTIRGARGAFPWPKTRLKSHCWILWRQSTAQWL